MGNDFELRIGMTTQQVMSNISRMNATDKTKQMIINFCNNDQDKKISNEIELAMLNSWASGSERVKMPTEPNKKPYKTSTGKYSYGNKSYEVLFRDYKTDRNGHVICFIDGGSGFRNVSCQASKLDGFFKSDVLLDNDCDGYADERLTEYDDETDCPPNLVKRYRDTNIDGVYDELNTTRYKNDEQETRQYSETDLHTNETKEFKIWYDSKNNDYVSQPKTDLHKLHDWY